LTVTEISSRLIVRGTEKLWLGDPTCVADVVPCPDGVAENVAVTAPRVSDHVRVPLDVEFELVTETSPVVVMDMELDAETSRLSEKVPVEELDKLFVAVPRLDGDPEVVAEATGPVSVVVVLLVGVRESDPEGCDVSVGVDDRVGDLAVKENVCELDAVWGIVRFPVKLSLTVSVMDAVTFSVSVCEILAVGGSIVTE
jgi:hypothetical protein